MLILMIFTNVGSGKVPQLSGLNFTSGLLILSFFFCAFNKATAIRDFA